MGLISRVSSRTYRFTFFNYAKKMNSLIQRIMKPVVISGPSGVGETTLLTRLFSEYPNQFAFTVSHTTRSPRPNETHGKDYYFISTPDMKNAIAEQKFLEHAQFAGNYYGTSKFSIEQEQAEKKIPILDLDEQGVRNIKQVCAEKTDFQAKFVFVQPPSVDDLESRLRERGTETEESLKRRMDKAKSAMEYAIGVGDAD